MIEVLRWAWGRLSGEYDEGVGKHCWHIDAWCIEEQRRCCHCGELNKEMGNRVVGHGREVSVRHTLNRLGTDCRARRC